MCRSKQRGIVWYEFVRLERLPQRGGYRIGIGNVTSEMRFHIQFGTFTSNPALTQPIRHPPGFR
eukprot:4838591-Heterocapsa_arctica.AAC.1